MQDAIPMITLVRDLRYILPIDNDMHQVYCTIFEDNNLCIELVKRPKMQPRTKYIGSKYHPFRYKVQEGLISIKNIHIKYQLADLLTKALSKAQFLKLRKEINGW